MAAHGGPLVTAPGVFVDHREGGRLAARHLADLGHTSLAMIDGRMGGKVDGSIWELRATGFLAGAAEAGLDPASVQVILPGDCHTIDGERVGRQLLESSDPLPGAVFCQSDELAFGLIATLRRADVQCPRDISVIGFDDHPMSHLWDLTTIAQHTHEQGVRAATALLDILGVPTGDDSVQPASPDSLHIELIVRESTGAPKTTR